MIPKISLLDRSPGMGLDRVINNRIIQPSTPTLLNLFHPNIVTGHLQVPILRNEEKDKFAIEPLRVGHIASGLGETLFAFDRSPINRTKQIAVTPFLLNQLPFP